MSSKGLFLVGDDCVEEKEWYERIPVGALVRIMGVGRKTQILKVMEDKTLSLVKELEFNENFNLKAENKKLGFDL
jgi:hypothetical protein